MNAEQQEAHDRLIAKLEADERGRATDARVKRMRRTSEPRHNYRATLRAIDPTDPWSDTEPRPAA